MADKAPEAAAEKKPLDIKLILTIVFALVNVGVAGYGLFLTYKSTLGWTRPEITEEQLAEDKKKAEEAGDTEATGYVYTMDKFTVNLGGEPKRTIRLEVNLSMLGKEGFEEIIDPDRRAIARDKIIKILNEKSYTDLETIQGKLFLKDTIAMEVNSILNKGIVKDVFFTDFVAQ